MHRDPEGHTKAILSWSDRINMAQADALALRYVRGDRSERSSVVRELIRRVPVGIVNSEIDALRMDQAASHAHAQLVGEYAAGIGGSLGLSPPTIRTIRQAAALHDIGKLGIPRVLLSRPGALSCDEYELVKLHPQLGMKMLEPHRDLGAARPLILHHHERYDGKGYPAGLSGERIPLGARIIAIADSIDAMRSARSYKPAFPIGRVRAELVAGAGSQYDPVVVDATLRWMDANPDTFAPPEASEMGDVVRRAAVSPCVAQC